MLSKGLMGIIYIIIYIHTQSLFSTGLCIVNIILKAPLFYRLHPELSCNMVQFTFPIVFLLTSSKPFPLSCPVSVNLIYSLTNTFFCSWAHFFLLRLLRSFCLFTPKKHCRELHRALAVCGWQLHWFSPSMLSCWPGRVYSGDVSTWQEESLSSLHYYLPEVAVAHFKASVSPPYSCSILCFLQHPSVRTSGDPQGISLNPRLPVCQPALLLTYSTKFYTFVVAAACYSLVKWHEIL